MNIRIVTTRLERAGHSSGMYCDVIRGKASTLADARDFLRQIIAQVRESQLRQKNYDAIAIALWGVLLTCDIIIDSLRMHHGVARNFLIKEILKAYDNIRSERFKDSGSKDAVEKIQNVQRFLEEIPGLGGNLATLFGNAATNVVGLVAYDQVAGDIQRSFYSQQNQLQKQLENLDAAIKKIEIQYKQNCLDLPAALKPRPMG